MLTEEGMEDCEEKEKERIVGWGRRGGRGDSGREKERGIGREGRGMWDWEEEGRGETERET